MLRVGTKGMKRGIMWIIFPLTHSALTKHETQREFSKVPIVYQLEQYLPINYLSI